MVGKGGRSTKKIAGNHQPIKEIHLSQRNTTKTGSTQSSCHSWGFPTLHFYDITIPFHPPSVFPFSLYLSPPLHPFSISPSLPRCLICCRRGWAVSSSRRTWGSTASRSRKTTRCRRRRTCADHAGTAVQVGGVAVPVPPGAVVERGAIVLWVVVVLVLGDRKSTRLNSSHL